MTGIDSTSYEAAVEYSQQPAKGRAYSVISTKVERKLAEDVRVLALHYYIQGHLLRPTASELLRRLLKVLVERHQADIEFLENEEFKQE